MLRGYRLFVLAVGLILCGAQAPQEHSDSKEGTRRVAPALKIQATAVPIVTTEPSPSFTAYPDYDPDPCYRAKDHNAADLCAQWRAAEAAEKSADWSRWGVLASVVGISLLLWQIILTRKAVEATGKATKAMQDANEIATDTAKRQLRAYVASANASVNFGELLKPVSGVVQFLIQNTGQTPAYEVRVISHAELIAIDPDKFRFMLRNRTTPRVAMSNIGPGCSTMQNVSFVFAPHQISDILQGKVTIFFAGLICYRDAFGVRHISTFRHFFLRSVEAVNGSYPLSFCASGNIAN